LLANTCQALRVITAVMEGPAMAVMGRRRKQVSNQGPER